MERLGGADLDYCYHNHHDTSMISAEQLVFTYHDQKNPACQVSTCQIASGQFIVLCGPSGSGKSTFLKLLNGIIPDYYAGKYEGRLDVADCQAGRDSVETFSRSVASVFQNPASQFFYREVQHELVFPCENQGLDAKVIMRRLWTLAEDFAFAELLNKDMFGLSGGQKQRVAIATAIMQGTNIMLFDEPTANLDSAGIAAIKAYLTQLKAAGKTIIVAEHRLHYLMDLADNFFYFKNGRLTDKLTTQDLLALTDEQRQDMGLRRLDLSDLKPVLAGKIESQHYRPDASLCIEHLTVRAGSKILRCIEQLSFAAGSISGITGSNGLGKSQLVYYIAGILDDKKATIKFQGIPLSAKQRLSKTSIVLQEVSLQLFAESVSKEVNLGHERHPRTTEVIERLSLTTLLERHPASLSGGEQQRVMIAASLLADKDILIFDEPSSGLDLLQMKALANLLMQLKTQHKVVILISHDEELLSSVCDTIYQMLP
ncbi:TPA: ABC transporter ATP-binding protein [Streptococcus pyogenes]|uniref:ABC transporter ATP-binding protein n=1 Tax=Streptococcus pyogenes TaxID=1314 RepID=UPI00067F2C09|nr:ABC transporter ATP-binding protein [Streptococcus pyogenes]HER4684798.1 ABC transporter ATP-binding protein [Streptococcus pyogenes NGAS353]HER4758958.1 ABC transporter ATP-binding protein [Streptococcus pyogenes NGAS245]OAC66257.1 ABC transporter ATP-binding protein [Streptococcus pyogenes]OAC78970.1 ABC transporter ATP-binding protein [Streptococcus pyogenes]HEP1256867.1 ABC transporter ATP-binding protein [Streptococcus pyogenes]